MTVTLNRAELLAAFAEQRRQEVKNRFEIEHTVADLEKLLDRLNVALSVGVYTIEEHLMKQGVCSREDLEQLVGEDKVAGWYSEFEASRSTN